MDRFARIDRRHAIKLCGIVPVLLSGTAAIARSDARTNVVLFDDRNQLSRQYAALQPGLRIDLTSEERLGWRTIRSLSPIHQACGLTHWGEFLMVRSFLEEKGLRLRSSTVRPGGLIHWHMTLA